MRLEWAGRALAPCCCTQVFCGLCGCSSYCSVDAATLLSCPHLSRLQARLELAKLLALDPANQQVGDLHVHALEVACLEHGTTVSTDAYLYCLLSVFPDSLPMYVRSPVFVCSHPHLHIPVPIHYHTYPHLYIPYSGPGHRRGVAHLGARGVRGGGRLRRGRWRGRMRPGGSPTPAAGDGFWYRSSQLRAGPSRGRPRTPPQPGGDDTGGPEQAVHSAVPGGKLPGGLRGGKVKGLTPLSMMTEYGQAV